MLGRIYLYCLCWPVLLMTVALGQSTTNCPSCADWNRPQTPFQIFGNTYYVGTHNLSSILITSDAGNVLLDGDLPESAEQIVANIRSLGFRVEDVKIIVNSHVHFDHAGGIRELQRLSGARVYASPWSAAVMRTGAVARDDPQYGITSPISAVKNVIELHDGETLQLGRIKLTAHLTP
jgi:metallo-beta-lactamase class B